MRPQSALQARLDVPEYLQGFAVIKRKQSRKGAPRGPRQPEQVVKLGRALVAGASPAQVALSLGLGPRYVTRWGVRLGLLTKRKPKVKLPRTACYWLPGWREVGGPWVLIQVTMREVSEGVGKDATIKAGVA